MKKLLAVILSLLIFILSTAALAESTSRVDAFVFFGLYIKRMLDYQSIYSMDVNLHIKGFNMPMSFDGKTTVTTTAGDLTFNNSDYLLNEVLMTVYSSDQDDASNNLNLISACAAMSALEYDELAENLMKSSYDIGAGGAPSAIQKTTSEFNSGLTYKISVVASQKKAEKMLVYSGNYDYYVQYYKPSSGNAEIVFLIANAREK